MSWLRLGGAVAAVVIATSVAVACGDTTSITIVEAADGGAEAAPDGQVGQPQPDAGSDSATADGGDAGDAATVDGGDDGAVACSTAPTGTVNADDCSVENACPFSCSAKTPWIRYTCANAGERPSIFGCVAGGVGGGTCCPPTCVRTSSQDPACVGSPGGTLAYSCPRDADGGDILATPRAGCSGPSAAGTSHVATYCCP
jgi:hypothetical protein